MNGNAPHHTPGASLSLSVTGSFAIASREELWSLAATPTLLERRLDHGEAHTREDAIDASDARHDSLVVAADAQMERLHATFESIGAARVRAVATSRLVGGVRIDEATLTIAIRGVSVVTTPVDAARDAALLRELVARDAETGVRGYRDWPIVWRNGSGAVLLHEAVGHSAEHEHAPLDWPSWLEVRDEPRVARDDIGAEPRDANLLAGEPPACRRRESFRDVPLRRMTTLVASQNGAPFELPPRRIDVHLVAGGGYDPLTETVTVSVMIADAIDGEASRRIAPFTIVQSRETIARALAGATGEPIRYPGVVCSSEGQELIVGSYAPLLVTKKLA